jgi:hypothetical protein
LIQSIKLPCRYMQFPLNNWEVGVIMASVRLEIVYNM